MCVRVCVRVRAFVHACEVRTVCMRARVVERVRVWVCVCVWGGGGGGMHQAKRGLTESSIHVKHARSAAADACDSTGRQRKSAKLLRHRRV